MKKTLYVFAWACSALLAMPAAAQVPSYVPTDGLVGWWPFNGNANDESGNGNDGVVNGATASTDRNDIISSAFLFDGLNDWISMPSGNTTSINITANFSVSFWFKTTQGLDGGLIGFGDNLNANGGGFLIAVGNGNVNNPSGKLTSMTGGSWYTGLNDVIDNNWHFACVVLNESSLQFILDGSIDTSFSNVISPTSFNGLRAIGARNNGLAGYFNGKIDDVGTWNRALTEQEIQNLYTGQYPTVATNCTSLPSNLQQGLVGYWPFCGNANDESGNGNDGTVNGATLTEDRFGNTGAAYDFNGGPNLSADRIICNNPLIIDSDFSFSFWLRNESASPDWTVPLMIQGNNSSYEFYFTQDSISFVNFAAIINAQLTFGNSVNIESFNNYCFSYDGSELTFYLNGNYSSSFSTSNLITPFDGQLFIGKHCCFLDDMPTGFNGAIDDIAIYNRALTPEEVQELYTLDACTFTVYDTTYVTVYDTVTTYVTVTDTLLIDITFTGFEGQPSWLNTVMVFPNPASDHITIDYGNFALMTGYNTIITDAAGATVYSSAVNSQQVEIDINAWGAMGVYYMSVYDASGALVAVRHIVLE